MISNISELWLAACQEGMRDWLALVAIGSAGAGPPLRLTAFHRTHELLRIPSFSGRSRAKHKPETEEFGLTAECLVKPQKEENR